MTVDIKRILIPTDFSAASQAAIDHAVAIAEKFQSAAVLMHAFEVPLYPYDGYSVPPADWFGRVKDQADEQLASTLASLRKRIPAATSMLRQGIAWQEILDAITETQANLVVMATHGRRGVSHLFLGSVAEKIVRLAPVPVLTVRVPD